MGKGERRGGRAGRRARHHHHHFQRRRRGGGGRGGGVPLSFSGPGAARSYTTLGVCFLIHAVFIILSGIPVIVLLADVSLMPLMMFGIGGALLVAGAFLCARGKRRAAKEAATSPAGQEAVTSQPEQAAGTRPQPSQGAQPTAPDPTAFGGTIPGQPMADFSYPSAGQPYPGSQPYPGPAAAGGFGPAPSAPPPSGPAPPPQYGFTYNTSDNYNTQYSAGTSDLPPPPAYSTVVNEKL